MSEPQSVDPEEYVRENREKVVAIIKNSDDAFTRACAWTLLDRYTPDREVEELEEELRAVLERREVS